MTRSCHGVIQLSGPPPPPPPPEFLGPPRILGPPRGKIFPGPPKIFHLKKKEIKNLRLISNYSVTSPNTQWLPYSLTHSPNFHKIFKPHSIFRSQKYIPPLFKGGEENMTTAHLIPQLSNLI